MKSTHPKFYRLGRFLIGGTLLGIYLFSPVNADEPDRGLSFGSKERRGSIIQKTFLTHRIFKGRFDLLDPQRRHSPIRTARLFHIKPLEESSGHHSDAAPRKIDVTLPSSIVKRRPPNIEPTTSLTPGSLSSSDKASL